MKENARFPSLRTSDRCHWCGACPSGYNPHPFEPSELCKLYKGETDSHASVATLARNDRRWDRSSPPRLCHCEPVRRLVWQSVFSVPRSSQSVGARCKMRNRCKNPGCIVGEGLVPSRRNKNSYRKKMFGEFVQSANSPNIFQDTIPCCREGASPSPTAQTNAVRFRRGG